MWVPVTWEQSCDTPASNCLSPQSSHWVGSSVHSARIYGAPTLGHVWARGWGYNAEKRIDVLSAFMSTSVCWDARHSSNGDASVTHQAWAHVRSQQVKILGRRGARSSESLRLGDSVVRKSGVCLVPEELRDALKFEQINQKGDWETEIQIKGPGA